MYTGVSVVALAVWYQSHYGLPSSCQGANRTFLSSDIYTEIIQKHMNNYGIFCKSIDANL
jgi:hypothetical protein